LQEFGFPGGPFDFADEFTADRLAAADRIVADAIPDRRNDPNAPGLAVGGSAKGAGLRHGAIGFGRTGP